MGKIIATCGHAVTTEWTFSPQGTIFVKEYNREGKRAVSYISVCPECRKFYEKEKLILPTKEAQNKWLRIRKNRKLYLDNPDNKVLT